MFHEGSGPEGEPFGLIDFAAAKEGHEVDDETVQDVVQKDQSYAYVPPIGSSADQGYNGFGFSSWKSGPQAFPNIKDYYNGNLARSMKQSGFGSFLKNVVHQLDSAVSVENH